MERKTFNYPLETSVFDYFTEWVICKKITTTYEFVSPSHRLQIMRRMEQETRIETQRISKCPYYSISDKEEKIMKLQNLYFYNLKKLRKSNTYYNHLFALERFIAFAFPIENDDDFMEKLKRYISEKGDGQKSWTDQIRNAITLLITFLKSNNKTAFSELELFERGNKNFEDRGKTPCVTIDDYKRVVNLLRGCDSNDPFFFQKYSLSLVIQIGFRYGFRISEILTIKTKELLGEKFNVKIWKTGKQSTKPIFEDIRSSVRKLVLIKKSIGIYEDEFLFANRFSNPLTYQTLREWIEKFVEDEDDKNLFKNTHAVRRGFITYWHNQGLDVGQIAAFANKSVDETQRYIDSGQVVEDFKRIGNSKPELICQI